MAEPRAATTYLIVGRIRKPHGVRGELAVTPITDTPDEVFASGRRLFVGTAHGELDPAGRELSITAARPTKDGWLVTFAGVSDRTEAERWRECFLLASAADLAAPDNGQVYRHDLVGLRVEHVSGETVGTVSGFFELPQGLLLEVARDRGGSALIPYREEIVRRVDLDRRLLIVDPPVGLL